MNTTADRTDAGVREIPFLPDGEIRVILAGGELRISGVDGDTVRVRTRDARPVGRAVRIVQEGRLLDVRTADQTSIRIGPLSVGAPGSGDLDLEVPRASHLVARTASGDITAEGLTGETSFASASGDLRLDLAGRAVRFETMSGDVELRGSAELTIEGRSVSGDIEVAAPRIALLHLATTSGDLDIGSELAPAEHTIETISGDTRIETTGGLRVEATTVAGDIRISGPERLEEGKRVYRIGDGAATLSWRSMSGDLTVVGRRARVAVPTPPAAVAVPEQPPAHEVPAAAEPMVVAEAKASPNLSRGSSVEERVAARRIRTERQERARLEVLHAVERGELSIDDAAIRLAALDDVTLSSGGAV